MTAQSIDSVTLAFNSFAERLECSGRLYQKDKAVELRPVADVMLTVPKSYLTDEIHGAVFKEYNFKTIKPADLPTAIPEDEDENAEVEIDLETLKRLSFNAYENLRLNR